MALALERYGVTPALVPRTYVAEAVVEALAERGELRGKHILLPRAREARDVLPDGLRALGAVVDALPVYETVRDVGPVRRRGDRAGHRRGRPGAGNPGRDRSERVHGSGTGGGAGAILRGRRKREEGRVTATLKIGTRGSRLALWQAEWVRAELARRGVVVELVIVKTRGDADVDRPLHELEGKGFFTKEIEEALLAGRIDVAVHSLKDLP